MDCRITNKKDVEGGAKAQRRLDDRVWPGDIPTRANSGWRMQADSK